MPYCTSCGQSNPDNYRFCGACGKPRSSSASSGASTAPVPGTDSAVERARALFIEGTLAYRRGEVENPYEKLRGHEQDLYFLATATSQQAGQMVWPNLFSPNQKASLGSDAYLTYLNFLLNFAEGTSPQLLETAFWAKTLVYYNSNLDAVERNGSARDLVELTEEYLEEARATGSALCLTRALVKSAAAKAKIGDRVTALRYLDEFERIAPQAPNAPGSFPGGEGATPQMWVAKCREEALLIRRRL